MSALLEARLRWSLDYAEQEQHRDIYVDDEVMRLVDEPERLAQIVYGSKFGSPARIDGHEDAAIEHLGIDIGDLKREVAEKERAQSALAIRKERRA